jgi:hypothetical protein
MGGPLPEHVGSDQSDQSLVVVVASHWRSGLRHVGLGV